MASWWQSSKFFLRFMFSIVVSGDSSFYFIELIMFVSLECILSQNKGYVG